MELRMPRYVRTQMIGEVSRLPGINDVVLYLSGLDNVKISMNLLDAHYDIGFPNKSTTRHPELFYSFLQFINEKKPLHENVRLRLVVEIMNKRRLGKDCIASLSYGYEQGRSHLSGTTRNFTLLPPEKLNELIALYSKAA